MDGSRFQCRLDAVSMQAGLKNIQANHFCALRARPAAAKRLFARPDPALWRTSLPPGRATENKRGNKARSAALPATHTPQKLPKAAGELCLHIISL